MELNSYELSRNWFDWCFENPDKVSANDTALFMWLIEKNNRCGWAEKFSVTSTENMYACGFKTYPPYKKSFDRLVEFGFILIVKKSLNQYQSNVIAISKNNKATKKALDKASLTQSTKHIEGNQESTFDINKQLNKETENKETDFDSFWELYGKKKSKSKSQSAWKKLTNAEIEKIFLTLPDFLKSITDKKFLPHATTYLNGKRWEDEIEAPKKTTEFKRFLDPETNKW